jgi:hypothetical protein
VVLKLALCIAGLLGVVLPAASAQEMRPPRLVSAKIDWPAALASLSSDTAELRAGALATRPAGLRADPPVPRALARLNAAMSGRFPDIARSPVPVLLPFDTDALLRDLASGSAPESNDRYLSGFEASKFFYPGPSGYDAVFSLRTNEIAEFKDIKFPEPIDVVISGSSLLYELDDPTPADATPVKELEADFPGIRRVIHEHHVRYTFVRYGVPYMVSTSCFNSSVSRYKMPTCKSADRVLHHFLRALRLAGGTPQPQQSVTPLDIERPAEISATFSYHRSGRLLPETGFRGHGGVADNTVYSQIRFPLADPPAFVNSQMFPKRKKRRGEDEDVSQRHSYPWRDNFCERRGFPVGQCPGGIGHQGQDIRTMPCPPNSGDQCTPARDLVAVRDGIILRRPKQEAVYLFVNTGTEHIRFRYLHMVPSKMDADNLLSGRRVHEGEVIAQVGNYNKKEAGTSYHLHFDVQVPTKDGWVFVNPYMTLVAAYERLIGGRGEPIEEPVGVATTERGTNGSAEGSSKRAEPDKTRAAKKKRKSKSAKHNKRENTQLAQPVAPAASETMP